MNFQKSLKKAMGWGRSRIGSQCDEMRLAYSKTLNICGIKCSWFTENDIMAHFNFWRSRYSMAPDSKENLTYICNISLFSVKLYIV